MGEMDYSSRVDQKDLNKLSQALNELTAKTHNFLKASEDAEAALFELQMNNQEKLYDKKVKLLTTYYDKAKQLGIETEKAKKARTLQNDTDIKKAEIANKTKAEIAKIKADKALSKEQKKEKIKEAKREEKEKKEKASKDLNDFKKTLSKKEKLKLYSARTTAQAEAREAIKAENANNLFGKGKKLSERKEAFKNLTKDSGALVSVLADLAQQLNKTVDEIAGTKSAIDTRLQGWGGKTKSGSYWDQISSDITSYIGASPLIKQEDVVTNLKSMVGQGIAFNVEQRAFLDTISAKIADTFEATDGTLLRLVRIQQEDTTAARLGMESALTSFLNSMYETTEYMQEAARSIRQNISEASALMTAKSATEFEYQVQKWMGSLYSVGFDNTSGLSGALGKLAAGDISGISDGGYGNLLVMAANKANMSVADILATGLDSSDTNKLMKAMVEYLGQIYSETKNSNVLAQQYAGVFGLTASDLKAAANLAGSTNNIAGQNLDYDGFMTKLNTMANSMYQRTSIGERLSNAFANFQYGTAAGIANNAALYSIYKIAALLKDTTGGIDFSLPTVMGSGMAAQTFNIADILSVAALSHSVLGGIGSMLGGLFNNGSGLLSKFGINNGNAVVTRGTGAGLLTTSGATVSESGYTANANGGDVQSKSMTETTDEANAQTVSATEESEEKTMTDVDASIIKIYDLLQSVVTGGNSFKITLGDTDSWGTLVKENQLI